MSDNSARRWALPMLTAAYVLSQFYRSYVAVIATQLIDDFGFTLQWFGIFAGAFFFTFAIAQLPLGLAFDRFGVRRPILLCMLLGSVGAVLLPLTGNLHLAIFAQIALCIGCAPLYMGLLNFVLKTGNGAAQVRTVTIASAVGYAGAVIAGLPLAWGAAQLGWRVSMGVIGMLMVLATIGVALTLHEDTPTKPDQDHQKSASVVGVKASANLWSIAFIALFPVCFAMVAGGTFRMSWGGPYLADLFHFDLLARGYVMTAASVLALLWSMWIPRLLQRISVKAMVLWSLAIGVVAALVLTAAPASNALLGAVLICVLFCVGSIHPLVMSQARSVVPPKRLGFWLGVLNSMVFLGVALSNNVFGWIAEQGVSNGLPQDIIYSRLFLFTALLLGVGLLAAFFTPRLPKS